MDYTDAELRDAAKIPPDERTKLVEAVVLARNEAINQTLEWVRKLLELANLEAKSQEQLRTIFLGHLPKLESVMIVTPDRAKQTEVELNSFLGWVEKPR